MALQRGYSPAQFRDKILGQIGPFTVTATIPSTAAGANGTVAVAVPATLGLQAGDVLFVTTPTAAGLNVEAVVVSPTSISLIGQNGTGSAAFNSSVTYTICGFRFNQA